MAGEQKAGTEAGTAQAEGVAGESAKSVLGDEKVGVAQRVFDWLGVKASKVFAHYQALYNKHLDQFKSPEDVKAHVEYVLESPDYAMAASDDRYTLLVRTNGTEKAAVIEFREDKGKSRVRSAYTMSLGQLQIKIEKEKARGGRVLTGPANPALTSEGQPLTQGAGVPSDTLPRLEKEITTPSEKGNTPAGETTPQDATGSTLPRWVISRMDMPPKTQHKRT